MTETRAARRRWPLVVLACLAVAIGLQSATWWFVTGRILAGLPAGFAQAEEAGWHVQGEAPERTGWPWTASVRVRGFVASRITGSARWSAEALLVTVGPLDPTRLRLSWTGPQSLVAGQLGIGFSARQFDVVTPLAGGPLDVELRDLVVSAGAEGPRASPAGGPAPSLLIASGRGTVLPLAASMTLDGVVLRPALAPPFDGPATISARVMTTLAFPEADRPARSAAAWRDAGGRVDVPDLSLASGPLQVDGRMRGGLDADLQPHGQAVLRVAGAAAVLDSLARAGVLGAGPLKGARAVLQLLTLGAPGQAVPLTVTLEDRIVTVSRFPLARVPGLDWGLP